MKRDIIFWFTLLTPAVDELEEQLPIFARSRQVKVKNHGLLVFLKNKRYMNSHQSLLNPIQEIPISYLYIHIFSYSTVLLKWYGFCWKSIACSSHFYLSGLKCGGGTYLRPSIPFQLSKTDEFEDGAIDRPY